MKKGAKSVQVALIVFLIICIFFPGDPLGLKIPTLFLTFIFGIKDLLKNITSKKYGWIYFFSIVYPIILMIHSMILNGNVYDAISMSYPAVIFLLYIIISEKKIDYIRIIMICTAVMAVLTCLLVLFDIVGIADLNDSMFLRLFYKYEIGFMGKSSRFSQYYKVFFRTSPLLIFFLDFTLSRKKVIWSMVTVVALLFSGTRANLYVAMAIVLFRVACLRNEKGIITVKKIVIFLVFVLILLVVSLPLVEYIINGNATSGSIWSNSLKGSLITDYLNLFKDPEKLFIGSGFGSKIYSTYTNTYEIVTELSYFDFVKNTGLFLSIPFFVFIFYPLFRKTKWNIKICYLGFLAIAATNPFLYSSTSFVVYLYIYSLDRNEKGVIDYTIKKEKRKRNSVLSNMNYYWGKK